MLPAFAIHQYTTDFPSLAVVIGGLILGIVTIIYIVYKHIAEKDLERFSSEFLKIDKGKREKLLEKYIKRNDKYMRVSAGIFLNYYDKISENLRENLLLYVLHKNIKMIENIKSTEREHYFELNPLPGNLALNILEKYFDIIPPYIRNEIITQSISNNGGMEMIAKILEKNFEKFDENLRNELLLRFANSLNKNIKFYVSKIVSKHSKIIPEEIKRNFC